MKYLVFVCLILNFTLLHSRDVKNLGDTPWKFIKEEVFTPKVTGGKVLIDSISNIRSKQGDEILFQLKYNCFTPKNIRKVKVGFQTDMVAYIDYVICFYNQDEKGRRKLVYEKSFNNRKLVNKKSRAFGGINQTVGLLEYTSEIYLEESFNLIAQYVEMKITAQRDKDGKKRLSVPTYFDLYEFTQKQEPYVPDFDDSAWENIGLPHCYNEMNTYLNVPGNEDHVWRGNVWYRKHLFVDEKYSKKKFLLEFQSADVGATVYVNGVFQRGNSEIEHPEPVTHVGGFHPFVLDVTDALQPGKDNVISVRIGNSQNSFFTWPQIGTHACFGMGLGGINGNVYLHVVDPVYVPLNLDSKDGGWGTYVSTKEISEGKAVIKVITNIRNAEMTRKEVKLTTRIVDKEGKTILSRANTLDLKGDCCSVVENQFEIDKPILWYPNNSPHGTPYLYQVVNEIYEGEIKIDEFVTPLGIRIVKWDDNYCYINGRKHILKGFGYRNMYPALGAAVPSELQWRDVELIAKSGANTLRVGHSPATLEMVRACNIYGILLILNSNDNEWTLKNEPAISYKREYDKKAIITFRNDPSVVIWESNNGLAQDGEIYWPSYTLDYVNHYDSIQPRIVLNRDGYPKKYWNPEDRIVVGYTNSYKKVQGSPTLNAEVYGTVWTGEKCNCIARFDYENEIRFSNWYLNDYLSNMRDSACGWIDWMLTETFGEGYTIYLNGKKNQKSLGSSAMDGNRIPKLKYNIYKNAFWIDFKTRPGVVLQSSVDLKSTGTINAWSNCPKVELFINGESKGVVEPDQNIKHCTWNVPWTSGEYKVVGLDHGGKKLCTDIRYTSGEPYQIILSVQEQLIKPDSTQFLLRANGSDAAIIEAKIVDKNGHLCTLADNNIRFEVSGEGVYKGSYNFYVTEGKPIHYHAPGDKELQAEGGLIRVAVRTTFKPGRVVVNAYADGLLEDKVEYIVHGLSSDCM